MTSSIDQASPSPWSTIGQASTRAARDERSESRTARERTGAPVFFSLPVPSPLARMWPKDRGGSDTSPPHFTLLYVPKATTDEAARLIDRAREVMATVGPFQVELTPGIDTIPDGRDASRTVVIKHAHPKTEEKLRQIHGLLLHEAEALGLEASEFSGDAYTPHSTLKYVPTPAEGEEVEYDGQVPHGGWTATSIDACVDGETVEMNESLPLGGTPDKGARALDVAAARIHAVMLRAAAGRARYVIVGGSEAGELLLEKVAVGDRCKFVGAFEKVGDDGGSEGTVEDGAEGEVLAIYPNSPSLVVRVVTRTTDGGAAPTDTEVPPEAVTLQLADGDPRTHSATREVVAALLARVGPVEPETAHVMLLHRARVAGMTHEVTAVTAALGEVGADTWLRWGARTRRKPGLVRVAGLSQRTRELAAWALEATAVAGEHALGHKPDRAQRGDVLWALGAIQGDLEHGLPDEAYQDPGESTQIARALDELRAAIGEVEAVPESAWATEGGAGPDDALAAAREAVASTRAAEEHVGALMSRQVRLRNQIGHDRGGVGDGDEGALARVEGYRAELLQLEQDLAIARQYAQAQRTLLHERFTPEEIAASGVAAPPPDAAGPSLEATPPEVEARPDPSTIEPEPDPEPEPEPESSGARAPSEAGPVAPLMAYAGYMGRLDPRTYRVAAERGMLVKNKNTKTPGKIVDVLSPYEIRVEVLSSSGDTEIWDTQETGVAPQWKQPGKLVDAEALKTWRAGLPREAALRGAHGDYPGVVRALAAGVEGGRPADVRAWCKSASVGLVVNGPVSAEDLFADVLAAAR